MTHSIPNRILNLAALVALFLYSCQSIDQRVTVLPGAYGVSPKWVYLTWQGNTSTTMTVNFHTDDSLFSSSVYYGRDSVYLDSPWYGHKAVGTKSKARGNNQRWVHTVQLTGLSPGETYYFVAGDSSRGLSAQAKFRTIAANPASLRLAVGGDMGFEPVVDTLMRLAAQKNPDLVLIGGDLAYADGRTENLNIWDVWFSRWTRNMVTPDGYTLPMITSIGNHEVKGYFSTNLEDVPFYFQFFAQNGDVPHFHRSLGDLADIYVLDTYHITSLEDPEQIDWLDSAMAANTKSHQAASMALYHVPLYPGYSDFNDPLSVFLRNNWMPLFDKYGLDLAFENHDHVMKRTVPMKGGKPSDQGTVYIGDGAWGRGPRDSIATGRSYIANSKNVLHFWVVEVDSSIIRLKAYDKFDHIEDQYEIIR